MSRLECMGSHPYMCDACWNQRIDLKDVLNKRKKSRLTPGKFCLGVCGFWKSYASKVRNQGQVRGIKC